MTDNQWGFETLQVHAGQTPDSDFGARALPIYQTTSYVFPSTESAADRFALTELGPIYTRLTNPTQAVVEERLAALEGGAAALLVASGQAAELYAVLNVAQQGDEIVSSPSLYGGTYNLFKSTLAQFGITVRFVEDPDDPESWRALVNDRTRALYGETIPNPKGDLLDLEVLADIAHANGVPLIVDNTIGTPYNVRPFDHGADIVVESTTKFLGGHGTSIGGAIIEKGDFDWANGKFPLLTEPDASYNGLSFASIGPGAFVTRIRAVLLRDTGAAVSPFNAFLLAQGLETLSLRVERHLANAKAAAEFLDRHPSVESVRYSSLVSSPYYELARKYAPKGAGSVFTFEIAGGRPAGQAFIESLELFSHLANIGDVRSLAIHPASTTHSQMDDEELAAAGITPGTVRLSIGIETIDDIIADLDQALAAASSKAASAAE
ncbi:O-acetylhomoserine aminocarboxypropyltransferase/cysteine synthase [Actinobaculum sp. oral taxon 183 str. F0552]|jgi:O-acetylhomoserine aminocarboxypropyltransferase/cysteine synthase|uniref:O-acetylhomoserine aminocarboxypropyltransferase/cysteine synthase family protein n=1 Tax=Actinobaculum sp. oral taxon 183 TaxID=712888 RepID=UPI0003971869|nr:aminotransferase class I/II-fold pyridoxal phosphate-dependent enzyme [Actinobaculum sp. oral taxon 183]ERH14740.1 O-acetylhomoserine aminocarboxypropyltransferase/cysteine synthase [Actinobaculum sp. oral taxon 183 str. F0552]